MNATAYPSAQRRLLREALARDGLPLRCPACGAELLVTPVEVRAAVSYVRHRVWARCPGCRQATTLDSPPGAGDARAEIGRPAEDATD